MKKLSMKKLRMLIEQEIDHDLAAEHPSEIEPIEAFSGGDNLVHPVDYADVTSGRCMEHLNLPASYKDKTRAGLIWDSWWSYSKNLYSEDVGRYYLVTWLSERGNSKSLVAGKYEGRDQ